MSPNRYFFATVTSSITVLVGLAVMLVKSSPSLYNEVLQICGVTGKTCGDVISSVNPLSVILTAVFIWIGIVSMWQLVKTNFLVMRISRRIWPTPSFLMGISMRSGVGSKIRVVDGAVLFCAGIIKPRVYIGREILKRLGDNELLSALAHESYHLRNRDPLKVWLVTSLSKGLFFLPMISLFSRSYMQYKEFAADEFATAKTGKSSLSKALYKVASVTKDTWTGNLVPSFASVREKLAEPVIRSSFYWVLGISLIALSFIVSGLVHPALASGGCR